MCWSVKVVEGVSQGRLALFSGVHVDEIDQALWRLQERLRKSVFVEEWVRLASQDQAQQRLMQLASGDLPER